MGKSFLLKNGLVVGLTLLFLISVVTGNESVDKNSMASRMFIPKIENYNVLDMDIQFIDNNYLGKGKTCFGYKVYPNPDLLVCFDIDNPEDLITIGTPISSDKIAGGTWIDGVWWCCEYSAVDNSNIWIIDHITGDMTLLGASGEGLHSLAYDDSTGTMYACGATDLFTVDMVTGAATLVGSYGISNSLMIGIACDGYGNMYGEDLHTDSFYSIDPTTGAATIIGPLGLDLNYGQDMAIDKEDGTCYLAAFTVHAGNEGALYICNLTTGAPTKIGNFGTVPTQITGFVIPYVLNYPPDIPIINGPMNGKAGTEYEYTFVSVNPDEDDNSYYIEWGDGEVTNWTSFLPSGVPYYENHTWTMEGTYTIRAKAKDPLGAESYWGELQVTIPKNKKMIQSPFWYNFLERFPILQKLLYFL